MKHPLKHRLFPCLLLILAALPAAAAPARDIAWQPWSPQVFEQARSQHKFVFLYLEAVWCHWCHVMQHDTFADAAVQKSLAGNYLAVRVDHDANPLLAARYRDYGWPALIFFAPDGSEIVKRAGYIGPRDFARLLAAIVADPSPEAAAQAAAVTAPGPTSLVASTRAHLLKLHDDDDDGELGGLKSAQKFVDRDSVEYAISHADVAAEAGKALRTLDAAHALIDPVWGGVYQYSTGGDWQHPHFEKIMRVQASYLRVYALAYARWHREADLQAARSIFVYLRNFLKSPQGAFYVSQDADLIQGKRADDYFALDDAGRRRLGLPRIDRHFYADANGEAVEALAALYEASGDEQALAIARQSAHWALQHRALPGGGFRHGDKRSDDGPYLSDSLAMGRALLALYRVTGERQWLAHARKAADFIVVHFKAPAAGFLPAAATHTPLPPLPDVAENIATVRFLNLLSWYVGEPRLKQAAQHGMQFLSAVAADVDFEEAGILLADEELSGEPAHFTIVTPRKDRTADALFAVALRAAGSYKRVEWWDRSEGPLANADVPFPKLDKPAAFICASGRCSLPSFTPAVYERQIAALSKK
jgi:uncharacterized protein YyaL (SSP411 family)